MASYGELMREAAEREVQRWPIGEELRLAPRMQDITLEVIMRAVFGMREGAQMDRLSGLLVELLEQVMRPRTLVALGVLGPHRFRKLPYVKRMLARRPRAPRRVRAPPRCLGLAERERHPLAPDAATDEDGQPRPTSNSATS